ncbi:hypothetical protein AB0D12_33895 [Streptomyces sp. NPDC048479]|uniref:hypothetical protein n=1 Tax=Streptomyces sp. NPDC048479 TaxID=3154725 RepID=UPI003427C4CC
MTTSSWDRARGIRTAVSVLTVFAVAVGVLILALGMSVPEPWWPHTGHAFAADARPANQDPCALVVGPAGAYCERGTLNSASAEQHGAVGSVWNLVPAGAGVAALVVWRRRSAAGQRRR